MSFERRPVDPPSSPVLIVALEGWIDPGFAAATALALLLEEFDTKTFAAFDTDEFIDLRARRPRIQIEDGVRGRISWPKPRLRVGTDRNGKSVALLVGPEPDLRWKPFAAEVTGLALELGTELVVGLASFPAATPHTRPISVNATASIEELAQQIGYIKGSWERPARMLDVICAQCAEVGMTSLSLAARVPHYLGSTPFPPSSIALIDALMKVTGLSVDTQPLIEASEVTRQQIDELISSSEGHSRMVQAFEEQYDSEEERHTLSEADLLSGDELAAELERYLHEQH